jgi:hypothetical protein
MGSDGGVMGGGGGSGGGGVMGSAGGVMGSDGGKYRFNCTCPGGVPYKLETTSLNINRRGNFMDKFSKRWIVENGVEVVRSYGHGLTLRALHYQLVARGMTNDLAHYKRVVTAMCDARWDGTLPFDAFLDHERGTIGATNDRPTNPEDAARVALRQIRAWATSYRKHRWENQPYYPEVFIEKKALQGVFEEPCAEWDVALNPCKGYPSLTFLHDAAERFRAAESRGRVPVVVYFGDYDCTGEDIPRSLGENLGRLGVDVEVRRVALLDHQVRRWRLPPAPTKVSDTRSHNWDGVGQVELDAVDRDRLVGLCNGALADLFDEDRYEELKRVEAEEAEEFRQIIVDNFNSFNSLLK